MSIYTELNKHATKIDENDKLTESTTSDKLLIMFLNWNIPTGNMALGEPVINDGIMLAKLCEKFNYMCYYICNTSVTVAKMIIKKFVSMKDKRVIFYYSGHGSQTVDYDHDESDGYDECFVFNGGYLKDDDFIEIINNNCKNEHLSLIADCCHSGTIFDLNRLNHELVDKVCSISASRDNQTSKQLIKNGVFTLQMCQLCDESTGLINMNKLQSRLNLFDQNVVTYGDIKNLFIDNTPKQRDIMINLLNIITSNINTDNLTNNNTINETMEKQTPQKLIIQHINVD